MNKNIKLESQHTHILKLIDRDKDDYGWTRVSEQLFGVVSSNIPQELAIFEKLETGGRAKLTEEGNKVVTALKWLQ